MNKNWFTLRNEDTALPEVSIIGYIGTAPGETDYGAFKSMINTLKAKGVKTCQMNLNCGGGDMMEGLAIYDEAQASGIDFKVRVIGMAASMGSVLMLMGKGKPSFTPNAMAMFHKPQAGVNGEADSLRDMADLADSLETKIKGIIVQRTGLPAETVNSWFQPGRMSWFNTMQCKGFGLCDEDDAVKEEGQVPPGTAMPMENTTDRDMWQRVYNKFSITNNIDMKINAKNLAALNLTDSADEATINNAVEKLVSDSAELKTLKAEIATQRKVQAKAAITNAITAKKLTEADREDWEKNYEANPVFVQNVLDKMTAPTLPIGSVQGQKEGQVDNSDKSKWTVYDYQEKDHNGLKLMKTQNFAAYAKLYKDAGVEVEVDE